MMCLSGITVALALVPEAVAFAFVAGVDPMVGLYAAFMMGLITSSIGGRPGMISGATGATAVVMVALVANLRCAISYLLRSYSQVFCRSSLVSLSLVSLSGLVPYPVMLGFVNGSSYCYLLSTTRSV